MPSARRRRPEGNDVWPKDAFGPIHRRNRVLPGDRRRVRDEQLLGHEDIATRADIYVQPGDVSLEAKLRRVYELDA
jgi:hypothetical protein